MRSLPAPTSVARGESFMPFLSCSFYLFHSSVLLIAFSTHFSSGSRVFRLPAGFVHSPLTNNAILSGTVANCRSVMHTEATPFADATHSSFSSFSSLPMRVIVALTGVFSFLLSLFHQFYYPYNVNF